MQFSEGLSDRQAAEAVRARIDWKYALGLRLSDPGFDFSVLSEFRSRLVAGGAEHLLLESLLEACKERGYLKVRGRQRTDSTHVLGALRLLSKWERTAETLRAALNALASADPEWLTEHADPEWFERYGRRIEDQRLPKGKEAREEYLKTVGADGIRLLAHLEAPHTPQVLIELAEIEILCAGSGSSTMSTLTEGYGFSTQKRCLKPPTASKAPTRWRLATLPSARWVGSATRCISPRVATKDFLI
jgi:transposase